MEITAAVLSGLFLSYLAFAVMAVVFLSSVTVVVDVMTIMAMVTAAGLSSYYFYAVATETVALFSKFVAAWKQTLRSYLNSILQAAVMAVCFF